MPKRKRYAIVDLAEDRLHTMESAHDPTDLESQYPPGAFQIVDMDGKDDIPVKEGATSHDLTIDVDGNWQWKLTDLDIQNRTKADREAVLRNQLLSLSLKKTQAESSGPEYVDIAVGLQARIDDIQAELAGL